MKELSKQQMSEVSGKTGINVDLNMNASLASFSLNDPDGFDGGTAGNLGFHDVSFNNGDGGGSTLSGLAVNADPINGLVLGAPEVTNENLTLDVGSVRFGTSSEGIGVRANDIHFGGTGSAEIRLTEQGDGISADLDLVLDVTSLDLVDPDGTSDNTNSGVVRFSGGSADLDVGDGCCGTANLTGLTLNADGSNGLVVELPSGNFDVLVDEILLGENNSGTHENFGTSLGSIEASEVNLDGSQLEATGGGSGVDLDLELQVSATDVRIGDDDGWNGGSTGELVADDLEVTVDNGSGSPAQMTLDADGSRGAVVGLSDASLDLSTATVFLGDERNYSSGEAPSPVNGNLDLDGSQMEVFSR